METESRAHREELEEKVRERTSELWNALQKVEQREQDLKISQLDTIERLSIAAEFRDDETATHIKRMSCYCSLLAGWAGLDRKSAEVLRMASIMHDVGKIGIPDHILLKPGALTSQEFSIIERHTTMGAEILAGSRIPMLRLACEIALTHHERWDGGGYPRGLSRDQIPEAGRIVAVADVYDALRSARAYRHAWDRDRAVAQIEEDAGTHFDPRCVDAFLRVVDEWERSFADDHTQYAERRANVA
jgi:putative two-component system response regulator